MYMTSTQYFVQVFVSDITYVETDEGVHYLSLVTDAYSRKIMGYELSDNMRAESVVKAANGEITGSIGGTTYSVQYTTAGACPNTSIQTLTVNPQDDASFTLADFCEGTANSATITGTTGGSFTERTLRSTIPVSGGNEPSST